MQSVLLRTEICAATKQSFIPPGAPRQVVIEKVCGKKDERIRLRRGKQRREEEEEEEMKAGAVKDTVSVVTYSLCAMPVSEQAT